MHYLFHKKLKLFYASLNSSSDSVHCHTSKEREGRFLIKNAYGRATVQWEGYKPDIHTSGI